MPYADFVRELALIIRQQFEDGNGRKGAGITE